jgi:hypothetical protein
VVLYEDEVLQLKAAVNETKNEIKFNAVSFAKLYTEVQYLKSRLRTLEKIFDITAEHLGMDDAELHRHYQIAQTYSREGWPPHIEQQWADLFLRLSIDDLKQLRAFIKDDHPWKPFYTFCACMRQTMHNVYLKDQLEAAMQRLSKLVYLWGQTIGESPRLIHALIRDEAEPMKRTVNKLKAQKRSA